MLQTNFSGARCFGPWKLDFPVASHPPQHLEQPCMPSGCSAFLGTQRQASRDGAGLLSFQPPSSPGGLWVALPPCWAQLRLLHFPSIAPLKALSPQQLHLGTVERGGMGTENRCLSWEVTGVCNMRMPIVTQQEWCRPCTPLDRSVQQHLGSCHAETAHPHTQHSVSKMLHSQQPGAGLDHASGTLVLLEGGQELAAFSRRGHQEGMKIGRRRLAYKATRCCLECMKIEDWLPAGTQR